MKYLFTFLFLLISIPIFATDKYNLASFPEWELNQAKENSSYEWKRDPWSTRDTILEGTFLFIAAIDLWQTYTFLYINKDGEEKNSFLGTHPSKLKLFTVAGIWGVTHFGISWIIPCYWLRTTWQLVTSFVHFTCIMNNYNLGVRLNF